MSDKKKLCNINHAKCCIFEDVLVTNDKSVLLSDHKTVEYDKIITFNIAIKTDRFACHNLPSNIKIDSTISRMHNIYTQLSSIKNNYDFICLQESEPFNDNRIIRQFKDFSYEQCIIPDESQQHNNTIVTLWKSDKFKKINLPIRDFPVWWEPLKTSIDIRNMMFGIRSYKQIQQWMSIPSNLERWIIDMQEVMPNEIIENTNEIIKIKKWIINARNSIVIKNGCIIIGDRCLIIEFENLIIINIKMPVRNNRSKIRDIFTDIFNYILLRYETIKIIIVGDLNIDIRNLMISYKFIVDLWTNTKGFYEEMQEYEKRTLINENLDYIIIFDKPYSVAFDIKEQNRQERVKKFLNRITKSQEELRTLEEIIVKEKEEEEFKRQQILDNKEIHEEINKEIYNTDADDADDAEIDKDDKIKQNSGEKELDETSTLISEEYQNKDRILEILNQEKQILKEAEDIKIKKEQILKEAEDIKIISKQIIKEEEDIKKKKEKIQIQVQKFLNILKNKHEKNKEDKKKTKSKIVLGTQKENNFMLEPNIILEKKPENIILRPIDNQNIILRPIDNQTMMYKKYLKMKIKYFLLKKELKM